MRDVADDLLSYLVESISAALRRIPADIEDVYVVSLLVYDEDDDPRRPTITVGYNTEQRAREVMTGPDRASDEDEARWNFAFFVQDELAVIARPGRDPTGAALVEAWARANGYWYSDEEEQADFDATVPRAARLTEAFVELTVKAVRRLHDAGDIRLVFGRTIPLLIHELEYYDEIADQCVAANPLGVADEFARWCRTLEL